MRRHPALPDGDVEDPRMVRMLLDRVRLRASADLGRVATGELPDAHVRLEEREIFPWIEGAVPEAALQRLGRALRGL